MVTTSKVSGLVWSGKYSLLQRGGLHNGNIAGPPQDSVILFLPPFLILRLSARLFVLLGLIGGVMSHLDFQYISIVAWSYICVYRPVFPVWRCKTLKSAW